MGLEEVAGRQTLTPASSDSLAELLFRCHRDELLPLAQLLRVDADALGLSDLGRVIAKQVRRAGSHGAGNILLRNGEGMAWEAVLSGIVGRVVTIDVEAVELQLVRAWIVQHWKQYPEAERVRLWSQLGEGAPPETGDEVVAGVESRFGRGAGYRLSGIATSMVSPRSLAIAGVALMASPVGCVARLFMPILWPVFIWWSLRPDQAKLMPALIHIARLRQVVRHRITLGFVGSPSTGKDAAIKALLGIDSGNISPIAGSTKEVSITAIPTATALFVVNTPGMGDVIERVTEEARQVLDHIDIYVYLVNAEGGVQARELADYQRCVATGKPVLAVVNKVDVLRPRDKDRYLADARQKLSAPEDSFLAAAFDPLPALSPVPIGLNEVRAWIASRLVALGKDPDELPQG